MKTCPEVSVSRPATQCISVDLPEPDGPMMAVKRPRLEVDGDAVEGPHLGVAGAVDLHRLRRPAAAAVVDGAAGCGEVIGHAGGPLSAAPTDADMRGSP